MKSLELKIPPALVTVVCALLTWALAKAGPEKIPTTLSTIASSSLTFFGLMLATLGVMEFRANKTTVNAGTPEKSAKLVSSGVYRLTRNPMYLGLALVLTAFSISLRSPISLVGTLVFVLYITRFQIIPEERILLEKFGDNYFNYKTSVRRWL